MKNKRMMGLFLALLLFLIQASALAEPEIIINPDGTRTTVYRDNSGVIVSKYYHDADMQLYRTENFDHTGELSNYATITFTADGARQMDNYEADGTLTGRTLFFQDAQGAYVTESYDGQEQLYGGFKSYMQDGKEITEYYDADYAVREIKRSYRNADGQIVEEMLSPQGELMHYEVMTMDAQSSAFDIKKYGGDDRLQTWLRTEGDVDSTWNYFPSGELEMEVISDRSEYRTSLKRYNEGGLLVEESIAVIDGPLLMMRTHDEQGLVREFAGTADGRALYSLDRNPQGEMMKHEYFYNDQRQNVREVISRDGAPIITSELTYYENGRFHSQTNYDKFGRFMNAFEDVYDEQGHRVEQRGLDEDGQLTGVTTYDLKTITGDPQTAQMIHYWNKREDGVIHSYSREEDVSVFEYPDGFVEREENIRDEQGRLSQVLLYGNGVQIGVTTYTYPAGQTWSFVAVTRDMQGRLVKTRTSTENPDLSGTFNSSTVDAQGNVLAETVYEGTRFASSLETNRMGTLRRVTDPVTQELTTEYHDAQGNLRWLVVRDRDGAIIREESYDAPPPPPEVQRYVWYPDNTASTMGIALRDLQPGLTQKWYNVTPMDLSQDGVQSIPLIGGSVYIIGQVDVEVAGDQVTVSYTMKGSGSDTARPQSEFFTFFGSLSDITAVEPEDIGAGFPFGQPLSIEKDLNGDTSVLLFVRNVVTFRDFYTHDRPLTRYYPNHPRYVEYRQHLESIMD